MSRRREYLADATGAELTRNPIALATALEKIEEAVEPAPAIKRGIAHLCIADPLGKHVNDEEGFWSSIWATHPPMARRIAALREWRSASPARHDGGRRTRRHQAPEPRKHRDVDDREQNRRVDARPGALHERRPTVAESVEEVQIEGAMTVIAASTPR